MSEDVMQEELKQEELQQEEDTIKEVSGDEVETGESETEDKEVKEKQDDIPEEQEETTQDERKEKKIFKKNKSNALKSNALKEKIKELEEQRVRQLAEFENFRKRMEKEKSQMFEMGAKDVIEKLLPVMDNFERGFLSISDEEKETPFAQGVEMIYKQMQTAFEEMGVKPIEAVGKPFDPNIHNAVMTVDDEDAESDTVAEELQKGYMYKDSLIRPSMVKVFS